DAAVVFPSTDYVFDGRKGEPYNERDATAPLGAYGRSKLAGEKATEEANRRNYVVRTSWLFGPHGKNFVETMLELASERPSVMVAPVRVGRPTSPGPLPAGIRPLTEATSYGLPHMSGGGQASWYAFAEEISRQAKVDWEVFGAPPEEMKRPAPRPADAVLV